MTDARRFGRYRVTGTLGAGAMGEVFAAVDEVLGREVAVKTLKANANGLAARMLDDRFRQEARAIAALTHPAVVQVFDIGLDADPPYLVMERVLGPSLKERLAAGPLTESEVRGLGIQIGRALAAAHAARIIHRDVKPANILSAGGGTWKLADFGVAHVPDSSLTMTGQFVGSPAYAPPEALVRGQSDAEGDVYGLGAVLYQAAAGRWPRLDDTSGALIPTVPPIASIAPHLAPELASAIDRAVATEPAHRPTASELADLLAGAREATAPGVIATAVSGAIPGLQGPYASTSTIGVESMISSGSMITGGPGIRPGSSSTGGDRRRLPRWWPWAALGAGVLAVALIAGRGGSASAPTSLTPLGAPAGGPVAPGEDRTVDRTAGSPAALTEDGDIRVEAPAMSDPAQIRDWNRIADALGEGDLDDAREQLRDWEDRYGPTPETAALAHHLDALRDRAPGKSKGKGKGRNKAD